MKPPSETCYLCGAVLDDENRTMDHVPAKGLFPRPLPVMIKVPCCKDCNGAKSRDEEFFRLIATLGVGRTPEAEELYEQRTLPNTIRKQRLKTEVAALLASMEHHWMEANGVISLTPTVRVPVGPLKAVAEQIARGLTAHFHPPLATHRLHFHTYLPRGGSLLRAFALLADDLTELRIGDRAFHAYHGSTTESESVGVWLMTFHERIPAVVIHYDDDHADQMANSGAVPPSRHSPTSSLSQPFFPKP